MSSKSRNSRVYITNTGQSGDVDQWLQQQEGVWINAQVCRSKSTDKWYAEVNQWSNEDKEKTNG